MFKRFFIVASLALILGACSSEPTKEQVGTSIKKMMPVPFEVLQVKELSEIPGLFEVVLVANKQPIVLYVDKKAQYVISGSLMSLATKDNLTLETQRKFLPK